MTDSVYLNVETKNYDAIRSYSPDFYDGEITLIRAPEISSSLYEDPYLGWRKIIKGKINIIVINGDHNNFIESPEIFEAFNTVIKKL